MCLIILNFHGVGTELRHVGSGEHDCWLDEEKFTAISEIVKKHPNVELTFDDGNASDVDVALPILLRLKLIATFFVCSGRLDKPTFLSRSQVLELQDCGMRIGSHGVEHVSWRQLAKAQLRDELEVSRRELENLCGRTVDSAACPFGEYDRVVLRALANAGYRKVYTSDDGSAVPSAWIQGRTTMTRQMSCEYVHQLVHDGPTGLEQFVIGARRLFKRFR